MVKWAHMSGHQANVSLSSDQPLYCTGKTRQQLGVLEGRRNYALSIFANLEHLWGKIIQIKLENCVKLVPPDIMNAKIFLLLYFSAL